VIRELTAFADIKMKNILHIAGPLRNI